MHLLEPDVDLLTRAPCPEPGHIFDMRPTPVAPLTVHRVLDLVFPSAVMLGRARESRPGERLAFLVHGLAMNEDYFGLLVPELVSRGYDVWALRLPGYLASGQRPSAFWPVDIGFSVAFYGWVTASALAHLIRTSDEPPREVL